MTRLTPGDAAPDFTLPDADGKQVALTDLLTGAERGVVVYFYPKAGTPGCTIEACDFRDNLASLASIGYGVVGISADPIEDIKAFVEAEQLTFPLLSDIDHAVADAYGAWGPMTLGDRTFEGVHRCTFVVGADGAVLNAQYDVDARGHVAELRAQLAGA